MNKSKGKLTVYFEDPFWVGVFERVDRGKLSACKVTFGAEPRECEVLDFVLKNYDKLKFSPTVDAKFKKEATNPKRRQREAKKQAALCGIGTKSQQALQLQREEKKLTKKSVNRKQKEAEKQRKFDLKQQKRKAKHRGAVKPPFCGMPVIQTESARFMTVPMSIIFACYQEKEML